MRIPSSVFAARKILALLVVAGSIVMVSGQRTANFAPHDRAAYASAAAIQYVNPGLNFTIVSGKIASDGTITVDYKVTDRAGSAGLPLDINGVLTPGTISPRFLVAYIPKGQSQYVSYITSTTTAISGGATGVVAAGDSGGTTAVVSSPGEYLYTFKSKAPTTFDASATHRIAVYGSRNLTSYGLSTYYGTALYDFVPAGGTPAPRDVVRNADCNTCHSTLSFHGGSRVGVDICNMCHTPQSTEVNTGQPLDMKVMIHRIHMGSSLPSVKIAKKPYQIYGHSGYSDFSTVAYPSNPGDPRDCAGSCHNPKNGAAQTNNWMTKPSRAACGSCHDDVNFATGGSNFSGGATHINLPQVDDTQCAGCHIPKGQLEFDASIIGAHTNPTESTTAPGIVVNITSVQNGTAGQKPVVTFTVKDSSGKGLTMADLTGGSNRIALVMAGPTSDYGYTSFGTDVTTPGYVSESPASAANLAKCDGAGTCTYTFLHAIPAKATGTYAMGIEARRGITLLPGTTQQTTSEYGAKNVVTYFSVDGSKVTPRRTVVSINSCNQCHTSLSLHGENRNQIEMCVLCHNPSENDLAYKNAAATSAADKAAPLQSVNFALMIHKIHTGEKLGEAGLTYSIIGYGGSHNDFSDVRYPAMLNGSTGDTANCNMCHVNNSQAVFPIGKNPVLDTAGLLSPAPATTSACTACHFDTATLSHAVINTDPKFGESCTVCHAAGKEFDVIAEHAGK